MASAGPGGYQLFPYQYGLLNGIADRDVVANIHIAHTAQTRRRQRRHPNSLRQRLFAQLAFYSSTNDAGGPAFYGGAPRHIDRIRFHRTTVSSGRRSSRELFKAHVELSSIRARIRAVRKTVTVATIPLNARDVTQNTQGVVKLSYQKNFSSEAFLRVYGYSYYSDWLNTDPTAQTSTT